MLSAGNVRVPEPENPNPNLKNAKTRTLEISEKLRVYYSIASLAKERRQTRLSCPRTETRVSAALNLAQPLLRRHFREVDNAKC
ncbi:hypothetical protein L596_016426 [Steinernema carpocapsae]|uniref:Uncharacterized protein n=1 Tax=Steinernema carpocapsae TaxID=34508 RepID=A0A4U5NIP7_STECR|nr:hypothetical protein L596_016426 [Steinernema carpocapsae]